MSTPEVYIDSEGLVEDKRSWLAKLWDLCRRQPLGAAGALVVILMILMAVFANYISPYDPELAAFEHMLEAPNADFWFGTDQFGRDILTRLIYGARTALFVGFTCAIVGATGGLVLGVAVGCGFLVDPLLEVGDAGGLLCSLKRDQASHDRQHSQREPRGHVASAGQSRHDASPFFPQCTIAAFGTTSRSATGAGRADPTSSGGRRIAGGLLLLEPRGQRPPRGLVRRGCG